MSNTAKMSSDDERLIASVRDAVRTGIAADKLESAIGKPSFTTINGKPIEMLRRMDITPDPDFATETFVYDGATAVAFWKRPVEPSDHNPRVVGVRYDQSGKAAVFFGILLPP